MKCTYLDLSTGHLTKETMENLERLTSSERFDAGWPAFTVAAYDFGAFVTVPWPDQLDQMQWAALPADLRALFDYARDPKREQRITLICLDADGEAIDALPHYEW